MVSPLQVHCSLQAQLFLVLRDLEVKLFLVHVGFSSAGELRLSPLLFQLRGYGLRVRAFKLPLQSRLLHLLILILILFLLLVLKVKLVGEPRLISLLRDYVTLVHAYTTIKNRTLFCPVGM